jgi:hypothetical protein
MPEFLFPSPCLHDWADSAGLEWTGVEKRRVFKVLPSHLSRAISSLAHPRICALHDIGHDDGIEYMVMEYLEGETLGQRLARDRSPSSSRRATRSRWLTQSTKLMFGGSCIAISNPGPRRWSEELGS